MRMCAYLRSNARHSHTLVPWNIFIFEAKWNEPPCFRIPFAKASLESHATSWRHRKPLGDSCWSPWSAALGYTRYLCVCVTVWACVRACVCVCVCVNEWESAGKTWCVQLCYCVYECVCVGVCSDLCVLVCIWVWACGWISNVRICILHHVFSHKFSANKLCAITFHDFHPAPGNLFIHLPRHIHVCAMMHPRVYRDSFMCVLPGYQYDWTNRTYPLEERGSVCLLIIIFGWVPSAPFPSASCGCSMYVQVNLCLRMSVHVYVNVCGCQYKCMFSSIFFCWNSFCSFSYVCFGYIRVLNVFLHRFMHAYVWRCM